MKKQTYCPGAFVDLRGCGTHQGCHGFDDCGCGNFGCDCHQGCHNHHQNCGCNDFSHCNPFPPFDCSCGDGCRPFDNCPPHGQPCPPFAPPCQPICRPAQCSQGCGCVNLTIPCAAIYFMAGYLLSQKCCE